MANRPRGHKGRDNHAQVRQSPAPDVEQEAANIRSAEEDVHSEWNIGDLILDTYEVLPVLEGSKENPFHDSGGMGLVYKVHHHGWNIDLAVKSPRPEYFKTEAQKKNFVLECETWVNLGLHPNIASCYYIRRIGDIPRVFAEYVEGGSLKDWIDSKKLYESSSEEALQRILDVAIQFAWGLQYAHEQGLIHQDVKPANVLMTSEGTPKVKVTDFGLAKARVAAGEKFLPGSDGSILVSTGGMTPAYCSPEQARGEKLSTKTDIWSWGLSVLEMFTGEVIWLAGQAAPDVLKGYLDMGAQDKAIPKMPTPFAELLQDCFRRKTYDRPTGFDTMIPRLKRIYEEVVGQQYSRSEPQKAELRADSLNHWAVSMLDLGKRDEAIANLRKALEVDAGHPEVLLNLTQLEGAVGALDPDDAEDRNLMCALLAKHDLGDQISMLLSGNYRVEPNNVDNKGGCFVFFKSK